MTLVPVVLYLVTLLVRPQDWVPMMLGFPTAYTLLSIGLALALPGVIREPGRFSLPQNKLIPFYLAIIFASTLVNVDSAGAFDVTVLFLKRCAVFFIVVWTTTSRGRLFVVVWTVLALTFFLAYQAILEATTGQAWGGVSPFPGYQEIRVRWYGDWDGPNVFGLVFVVALALAMEFVAGPHNVLVRALAATMGASYLVAIYYTNSRGAVLAVGAAALFYFRHRFRSMTGLVLAVGLVGAMVALAPSRMSQVSSGETSAGERIWLWEQGLTLLQQNPVLGVGRGQFARRVDLNLIAHNNYVQNFAELGLTGFFCFIALLWYSFKGALTLSSGRHAVDAQFASLGRMVCTALVGYAAATYFVVMELEFLYFLLGLSAATYLVARHEHEVLPPLRLTLRDAAVVVTAMTALIGSVWLAAVKEIL
jgi:putative inorganic carbon (hco3(-)) transporter